MKSRWLLAAIAASLTIGTAGWAFDTVKTTETTVTGTVKTLSPLKVDVDRNGVIMEIPVNEVVTIYFDDEPTLMKTARTHLIGGHYQEALDSIDKIKPEDVTSAAVEQDIAYYKAYCAAQLALGGTGAVTDAGRAMAIFVSQNPNSYHYYEACEVVGDLLVAVGKYADAETYYLRVAQAPWSDYKMRAGIGLGRARLAQNQVPQAQQAFDAVLAMPADSDLAKAQHLAANLGKARCLAASGQQEPAIAMIEKIVDNADPEDVELHARAYNTLGAALRKANRPNDALMAYLHVDVLYFTVPEAHAEALANLVELWNNMAKTERAVRARKTLMDRYPNSPWAKQQGG